MEVMEVVAKITQEHQAELHLSAQVVLLYCNQMVVMAVVPAVVLVMVILELRVPVL
jgi:hypothetical protein